MLEVYARSLQNKERTYPVAAQKKSPAGKRGKVSLRKTRSA
jgi:hypothetical protein